MTTRLSLMLAMLVSVGTIMACGGEQDEVATTGRAMGNSSTSAQPVVAPASKSGGNAPPTITMVTLQPSEPRAGERVTAVVETQDMEGDGVKLDYRWSIAGELIDHSLETLVLRSASKGDQVHVSVVARDAHGSGDPMEAEATVGNQIPIVRGVVFEPLGEVSVGSDVMASPRGFDADRDELSYEFEWSVNGASASRETTLSADFFRRGDEIVLSVVAYDGEDRSEALVSDPVEVVNAPPKIVSDPSGFDGEEFGYQVAVEDPDNDRAIRYNLEQGPSGMTLDNLSGFVSWKPSSNQAGRHRVTIRVEDQNGGSDEQSFDLTLGFESGDAPAAPNY